MHQSEWPGLTPAVAATQILRRLATYFGDSVRPLKSTPTISRSNSPLSVRGAPFWLASNTACAPQIVVAPAPPRAAVEPPLRGPVEGPNFPLLQIAFEDDSHVIAVAACPKRQADGGRRRHGDDHFRWLRPGHIWKALDEIVVALRAGRVLQPQWHVGNERGKFE